MSTIFCGIDIQNDDKEDEIHIALDESSEDDGKHGLSKNVQYEVSLHVRNTAIILNFY